MCQATEHDYTYIAHALRLAHKGLYTTSPNPRVGCVLVRDGNILAQGFHAYAGGLHAEAMALREVGNTAKAATAYVTLEPCSHYGRTPPCTDALIAAGIARVVIAMEDPNPLVSGQGIATLRQAGIEVVTDVQASQARALNPGFIKRMHTKLPWVRCKLAMSMDGRTAMADGESRWITSEAARMDVQYLRARACAILSGSGTIISDDPRLDVRLSPATLGIEPLPLRLPWRVILDTRLQTPLNAKIFAHPESVWLMTTVTDHALHAPYLATGCRLSVLPCVNGRVDLSRVLAILGEHEINELHVEAGATLSGALLEAGLCDELIIYVAPTLLGSTARPLLHMDIRCMAEKRNLCIQDIRHIGCDMRITARPVVPVV